VCTNGITWVDKSSALSFLTTVLDEQTESKYRTVVTTGQKHSWLRLTYLKVLGPLNCSLCIQIVKLVDLKKIYDLNSFCFCVVETVALCA